MQRDLERLAEQLERMVQLQQGILSAQSRINQHLIQLSQHFETQGNSSSQLGDLDMDEWMHSLLKVDNALTAKPHSCLRVMVVEDDAACQRLVSNYLHHLSSTNAKQITFQAIPAQDAHEALRLLTALGTGNPAGIQLVLMDVQLPGGLDGTQAACLIHAAHPSLPIIPMTSLIGPWDRARYRASGMQETILAKPFSRQGLKQVMAEVVEELSND